MSVEKSLLPYTINRHGLRSEVTNVDGTEFSIETGVRSDLGLSVAIGYWGQKVPTDSSYGDRMFETLYRTDPSLSYNRMVEQEIKVAISLGNKVMKELNIDPQDIGHLTFGSGSPINPQFYYDLAQKLHLTRVLFHPDANITASYSACNAGIDALIKGYARIKDEGEPILSIGLEGLTRLMSPDGQNTDELSKKTFSNGAAAILGYSGRSLDILTSNFDQEEDVKGVLSAITTYEELMDPNDSEFVQYVTKRGQITCVRLPKPSDGKVIDMNGSGAFKLFSRLLKEVLPDAKKAYDDLRLNSPELGLPDQPNFVVPHHASPAVVEKLDRLRQELGIQGEMPWLTDNNSSASTTMIAFARLLPRLKPSDIVLLISFGAGATATVSYVRIGQL